MMWRTEAVVYVKIHVEREMAGTYDEKVLDVLKRAHEAAAKVVYDTLVNNGMRLIGNMDVVEVNINTSDKPTVTAAPSDNR